MFGYINWNVLRQQEETREKNRTCFQTCPPNELSAEINNPVHSWRLWSQAFYWAEQICVDEEGECNSIRNKRPGLQLSFIDSSRQVVQADSRQINTQVSNNLS